MCGLFWRRAVDGCALVVLHAQPLRHLLIEKALARTVRLHPLAIDHKLRYGLFSGAFHDFVNRAGRGGDVDLFVSNVVLGEKALGFAAIRTRGGGVNDQFHKVSTWPVAPGDDLACYVLHLQTLILYPNLIPARAGGACVRSLHSRYSAWKPAQTE